MDRKSTKLSISIMVVLLTMAIFLWYLAFPQRVQAAQTPIKVMPLGDSITDGFTVAGGYRTQFYNRLVTDGLTGSLDFVGSQSSGPASLLDREHEGHTSWAIADLSANIDAWMTNSTPRIVMLMIGTNDILHSLDASNAPTRLSVLIDQICAKLPPGGKLYVAQIPPLTDPAYNALINRYNAAIPAIVQSKVNHGKPVILVNMNNVITVSDLSDGIHPTVAGYDKLGNAWYDIIKRDLIIGPTSTPIHISTTGVSPTWTRTNTPTVGVSPAATKINTPTPPQGGSRCISVIAAGSYPARINGFWHVGYAGRVARGRFEAK